MLDEIELRTHISRVSRVRRNHSHCKYDKYAAKSEPRFYQVVRTVCK